MGTRLLVITSAFGLGLTALTACGSSDSADGPKNAYIRFADGQGTTKEGRYWYLAGPDATVDWTAHGAARDGEPTVLKITKLVGGCLAARGEPCPGDDSVLDDLEPEEIPLPEDGSEKQGTVEIRDVQSGTRTRVAMELCRDGDCRPTTLREFRRPE